MKYSVIKSTTSKIAMLCVALLIFGSCKKDSSKNENHETYFKGKIGNNTIDFKNSFFYKEGELATYHGSGKIGNVDIGISLFCNDATGSLGYSYDVNGQTEDMPGAAVLTVVYPNSPSEPAGLSYYENCNTGETINSSGEIKIGKVEKVGSKEYITGSFNGTIYKVNPLIPGGCSYTQEQISIQFRILNRRDFGDAG